MPRVCIIGLDCLTPQLLFEHYWQLLPSFRRLAESGFAAPLPSSDPPMTIPAWTSMVTGVDPGTLGIYGFRDRADYSYHSRRLPSSLSVREPTIWSILSGANLRSCVIGVPQTYPPRPLKGRMVCGFPAPRQAQTFTHPPQLGDEVRRLVGPYMFDAEAHRSEQHSQLLAEVYAMTEQRFRLALAWLKEPGWGFFMMVDMGPDRLQHAFWQVGSPAHPGYAPEHPLAHVLRDYYTTLDQYLGQVMEALQPDDLLIVLSDHGAQSNLGGVALNEWLIERGYLRLHRRAERPAPLDPDAVDWSRSSAWADGGYAGRVHLNVLGREPQGIVPPAQADAMCERIRNEIEALADPDGGAMATRAHRPAELYRMTQGISPALIIYLDDLRRRALGTVGHGSVHVGGRGAGAADGANHGRLGVVLAGGGQGRRRPAPRQPRLVDVAPTVLRALGVTIPARMQGDPW